jgi:hypothetical protein
MINKQIPVNMITAIIAIGNIAIAKDNVYNDGIAINVGISVVDMHPLRISNMTIVAMIKYESGTNNLIARSCLLKNFGMW